MCKGEEDVDRTDGEEGDGEDRRTLVHDCCDLRYVDSSACSMTELDKDGNAIKRARAA